MNTMQKERTTEKKKNAMKNGATEKKMKRILHRWSKGVRGKHPMRATHRRYGVGLAGPGPLSAAYHVPGGRSGGHKWGRVGVGPIDYHNGQNPK